MNKLPLLLAALCLSVTATTRAQNTYPWPASGNVGIGTTSPQSKLDVRGSIISGNADFANSVSGSFLQIQQGSASGNTFSSIGAFSAGGAAWNNLVFQVGGGNVGIGTTTPSHKLSVNGTVRAKEVIVDTNWSDYVFADDYKLQSLASVEAQIKSTKHLPGVPSAQEIAEKGVSVGNMQAVLLAKIEELTLHVIAQEKRLQAVESENTQLKAQLK